MHLHRLVYMVGFLDRHKYMHSNDWLLVCFVEACEHLGESEMKSHGQLHSGAWDKTQLGPITLALTVGDQETKGARCRQAFLKQIR